VTICERRPSATKMITLCGLGPQEAKANEAARAAAHINVLALNTAGPSVTKDSFGAFM
jgi:hypothetical protein